MRSHPLFQLTLAKVRELLREPEALFWIFAFPLLLALALGLAFRSRGVETMAVGIVEEEGAAWVAESLDADPRLRARILDEDSARRELRAGRLVLVVIPRDPWTYWFDPTRPEGSAARLTVDDTLQRASGRVDSRQVVDREMTEKGSRYIDFLIPGLLGMNLMSTGIFGLGFYIVNSRQKKLLKRLMASPMRKSHFLAAQIGGRLIFLLPEAFLLLGFAYFALGVPLRGSLGALIFLVVLGAVVFAGIGLLTASRARTIEGVSGLMNLLMLPMWIFSGIFFSTSRFPDGMQPFIQALPLTPIIDSLRAVILEGATLGAVTGEIAIAAAWGVGSFVAALLLFRWT